MNTNIKTYPNNALRNNMSSFVKASPMINNAMNSVQNVGNYMKESAVNAKNAVKNILSSPSLASFSKPINDSIQSAMENSTSPFLSASFMIAIGILVILFIIVIVFREQIEMGLHAVWEKIKPYVNPSTPTTQPIPPPFEIDASSSRKADSISVEKIMPSKKEVFNIAQNKYKYSDAEPLCKAYGAELATYDQVKESWDKGADWCNYGWIKGQSAVFPTQEETYRKLQAGPEEQRGACGVVGVNGGYFDNPDMRFGVNCYGNKPNENDADVRMLMSEKNGMTAETLEYDKKVRDFKAHREEIPINPFKPGVWSS